ncbi:MAG: class I SAM-dependent methyltransferase [Cyanobacteria bacterium]|nr:class I SAM-dependent methyltransferase [Cyanobacteriota bacterium]
MDAQADYMAALVDLHRGLDHKGPGDAAVSRMILRDLAVPLRPRIADLGCGSGASAVLLAQYYQSSVLAVDASAVFIDELQGRIKGLKLESLITPICGDMGQLDWPPGSIDLLWSEGAAYNLGFGRALERWRSHLADGGFAVISELSWFTADPPEAAKSFWQTAYPAMGTEADNVKQAQAAGFKVVATHRLPSQAWWTSYYGPLRSRLRQWDAEAIAGGGAVVRETEAEMQLFEECSEAYGYTFYVLQRTD